MKRWKIAFPLMIGAVAVVPVGSASAALVAQSETNPVPLRSNVAVIDGVPRTDFEPHPSTQEPGRLMTMADLAAMEDQLSNWGRWGPDDQRGTLNLITREKTKQAAALVRSGIAVSLQHFCGNIHMRKEADSWRQVPCQYIPTGGAVDGMAFGIHDGVNSHMDALCHYWGTRESPSSRVPSDDRVNYNGYPFVLTEDGCRNLGIAAMGTDYVTRGVLYDMPLLGNSAWLDPSTPIYVEDLERFEAFSGVRVGEGDVMIVRTGRWALRNEEGPWNYGSGAAGLHASVLPWLKARGVALLVSDAVNDVQPSGIEGINRPVHQMTQVMLGLPIVDNGWPEEAAKVATQLKRWEFMVSWHNLHIPGGTASPWNAVATF